ncbi:MAG: tetratricopeptide repeat protein [Chitinophagaceae bacterium]|nr:tetratricopeptide repeat protein [Chitinophagaceae bacterium]
MRGLLTILLLTGSMAVQAQSAEKFIQQGNDLYRQQQFEKAGIEYNKALKQEPDNATAKLNLGNSLQKMGKEEEAIQLFSEVAGGEGDKSIKARAFYNKGAVLSKQKKLEESIEAYKNALRLNPADKEARENLQKALLEQKKKNPPKKKDDQQKKKKEQEQQKKQQQQPKMSQKEAEQRLKLLEQKEKDIKQQMQKAKATGGGSKPKDW